MSQIIKARRTTMATGFTGLLATLCVVLIIMTTSAKAFSDCFNMTASCVEDACKCACDRFHPDYDVTCPTVAISFEPRKYAKITCRTIYEEYENLPHMNIGDINRVLVKGCKMPTTTSFKSVLNRLGIQNVRVLFITFENKDFSNGLIRDHFRGFDDLERLSISNLPSLIELPEDFFAEVENITWLELKNVKRIEKLKAALSRLHHLEKLEVSNTGLTQLEEATFEHLPNLTRLGLWSNKLERIARDDFKGLHNLKTLDLLNNRFEFIDADSFDPLTNLINISLNKNTFVTLPEGMFKLNKQLEDIKMLYNNVSVLPRGLFADCPHLKRIDLTSSAIAEVPDDFIANSTSLIYLSLADNQIQHLPVAIFQGATSLEKLDLHSNLLSNLSGDLLMNCRQLRHLDLSHNQIESFPKHFFQSLVNLEQLYMKNNLLRTFGEMAFESTVNLQTVDASNNFLNFADYTTLIDDEIPNSPFHRISSMRKLVLRNNSIQYIHRDFTHVMSRLRTLDLSYNNITYVEYSHLQFNGNGVEVNVSHNGITEINFQYFDEITASQMQQPKHPPKINFDENPISCDCKAYYFSKYLANKRAFDYLVVRANKLTCNEPAVLAGRPLTSVKATEFICKFDSGLDQSCPMDCDCGVRFIDHSLIVNCSSAGLRAVPHLPVATKLNSLFTILYVDHNYIEELPLSNDTSMGKGYGEVRELYASHNNISRLYPRNIPQGLAVLDVSNNNIEQLDDAMLRRMNTSSNVKEMSLANNRWSCDCEMRDLLFYMQSNYERIHDYASLACTNGNLISKLSTSDICPQELQLIIIVSVSLTILGILLAVLAVMYYKHEEKIKIWMYWNNVLPFFFNSDVLDTNKKYDAFISYSHKDEDFVADQLMPELEQKRQFNLCIHRRDWTPGDFIPEQIVRSVADSRRTIIVLSPNYVESVWGTMEFRAAHRSAIDEQVSRVIVIVYGKVDREALDPELKGYIDMNTYIEWGDPWFWQRLHYALRTIKTTKTDDGALKKSELKSSVDDKLELIHPSPVTPPLTTPPAQQTPNGIHPYTGYSNGGNINLNGHVNGAFIINTNSKQSDV